MSTPTRRIDGLDGLRALACLAVFGVHFQQITGMTGQLGPFEFERFLLNGNTGVSLFFALSGFLLSLPFWRGDLGVPGRPWLARYIRSRVGRILPPYYLCLTVLVIHQRHWASHDELLDTLSHYLRFQLENGHTVIFIGHEEDRSGGGRLDTFVADHKVVLENVDLLHDEDGQRLPDAVVIEKLLTKQMVNVAN